MKIVVLFLLLFSSQIGFSQTIDKSYNDYAFVAGEKTIFEDNFLYNKSEKPFSRWQQSGGKISLIEQDSTWCMSMDEYYTKLSPILFKLKELPDSFSIEYDTWLDNGYDGNPGIEIHLMNGDKEILITPNKHELSVSYPNDGHTAKDNPEAYFGENKFYDRWVHIAIAVYKKRLSVCLDQYKMINIPDCQLSPRSVLVTGNESSGMKILLRNFRIATSFPQKIKLENGKFATRAIKFDVNKSVLKPESITVIRLIEQYMKENPSVSFEIGGHTDNDGDDKYNMSLSQQRAESVRNQLIKMGIATGRLTAKGYGESIPLSDNTTPEGKANNRRVEFIKR